MLVEITLSSYTLFKTIFMTNCGGMFMNKDFRRRMMTIFNMFFLYLVKYTGQFARYKVHHQHS